MNRAVSALIAATLVALPVSALAQETPSEAQTAYERAVAEQRAAQSAWEAGQVAYQDWNRVRRGWSTTESGLQYRRVGKAKRNAPQPASTDTVSVHYRGSFIDGREFDSSYSRNEPTSFPLDRVIKGWTEGVALMREGETYEFVIPADLAYGQRWVGGTLIPPGSTLLFTVELLKVNP